MQMKTTILLTAVMAAGLPLSSAQAGSLETHNNPVNNGDIFVQALDPDRSDWDGISKYQADVDPVLPVLSHGQISIAHDDTRIFFRMEMDNYDELDPNQSFFGVHHKIMIDLDQDRSTGWIGDDGDELTDTGFFAIGADIMIEGQAVWQYGNFTNPNGPGQNRELWTWGQIVPWGGVLYDDSPPSDIEIELLRSDLSDDLTFDFIPLTTDTTFDFQDVYPSTGVFDPLTQTEGDYFTYDINFVDNGIDGDLDGDGFVGINDLNIVLAAWNQNVPPANPLADPSGDGFVGIDDLNTVLGNWNAGTPPAGGAAVPEPASLALLGLGGAAMLRRRA